MGADEISLASCLLKRVANWSVIRDAKRNACRKFNHFQACLQISPGPTLPRRPVPGPGVTDPIAPRPPPPAHEHLERAVLRYRASTGVAT